MTMVIVDGVEYYQPECNCAGCPGHICYLRPLPKVLDIPIDKILASISSSPIDVKPIKQEDKDNE